MLFDIAIGVTWLAAGYRFWVLVRQPTTFWRLAISVSMACTAIAFTLYRFRSPLDQATGSPNLTGLIARVVFAVGAGFLNVYLDALRRPHAHVLPVGRRLAAAATVSLVMIISWSVAPVHGRTVEDFLPYARHTSVVVYCLCFWAYLVWVLAIMAATSITRARQFRREDPTRSISLMVVGVSAAVEVPGILLWGLSIVITRVTGANTDRINALGDAILPWPLLANAIGALSLLVLPYLSDLIATVRRLRGLTPLWRELTTRHPEVHLQLQLTGGPLTRLQLRSERAIIEIHDALRLAQVDIDGQPSLERLARGLRYPGDTGRRASDLLERVDTRDADIRQIVDLSRAFQTARP